MANWILEWRLYPDGSGGNHRHLCYVSDDATPQIVFASVLVAPNFADPDQMIPLSALTGQVGNGLATVGIGQQQIVGPTIPGDPINRNPVLIGAEAMTSSAALTPWVDATMARIGVTRDQKTITAPYSAPQDFTYSGAVVASDVAEHDLIPAPGAGVRLVPLHVHVSNESAVNVAVLLRNGAAGTIISRIGCPANDSRERRYPVGRWGMSAATKLVFQLSTDPGAEDVYVECDAMHSKLP